MTTVKANKQFSLILAPLSMNLEKMYDCPGKLSVSFVNYIHSLLWGTVVEITLQI